MPIICDWYHHDCLLSCCSIFKVLCYIHCGEFLTEVNSFIISHCFQLVKHFFQSFLISFWNRSFNWNCLFLAYLWAFWALVCRCLADSSYIISCPNWFVNTFFEKNPDFFQKSGKPPLFPFIMRIFGAKNSSFLYKSINNPLFFLFFFFFCIAI